MFKAGLTFRVKRMKVLILSNICVQFPIKAKLIYETDLVL